MDKSFYDVWLLIPGKPGKYLKTIKAENSHKAKQIVSWSYDFPFESLTARVNVETSSNLQNSRCS